VRTQFENIRFDHEPFQLRQDLHDLRKKRKSASGLSQSSGCRNTGSQKWCPEFSGHWETKGFIMERPSQKYLDYLNRLQASGTTNMYGAPQYLERTYPELDPVQANEIWLYWVENYDEVKNEYLSHL
jgi:hypothetical protein